MEEKQKIQELLKKVIAEEPNNLDKILSLTRKLALADTNKVRFSVDAGVIDRLGRELVARHETAVSELVKNAYDADAGYAKLFFNNVDNVGGQLIIEDDGNGMTRSQLVNGFMRISSSDKIHNPLSPFYGRKRAGKKGIGRFATQRLGNILTIITQTANDDEALKITINWNDYEMDKDLFAVANNIEVIPKEREKGTTLIINNLREWWTDAMIKRVYRYAIDVIQPFPLSEKEIEESQDNDEEELVDIGFDIKCYRDNIAVADAQTMFFEHALAEIQGEVDESGNGYWEIKNSKVDAITENPQKLENQYESLKGVKFRAYYFIYNINMIPKQAESYISSISNERGGIRLYRNGFRVLPFGEKNNDWLGLDASVRKRQILPVHSNTNFFGFVEISDDNEEFQELSNREGLFYNSAYQDLVDYIYKALTSAVIRVAAARGIKVKTNQEGWEVKSRRTPKETMEDAVDTLEKIAEEYESKSEADDGNAGTSEEDKSKKQSENREKAKKAREQAERLKETIQEIEEMNMLRVLAGLGIVIGEFTHEISQYLSPFEIDTNYLVDNLKENTKEYNIALDLKERFTSFRVYSSYFDETISENVNRELKPIDLRSAINPFFETMEKDLERNNIKLKIEYSDIELFTCKMHMSEWASILFNLYSNSKKALKRENPEKKQLLIKAGKNDEKVFVEFIDNGDGIPIENRDKIFNAFFTTSSPKSHKQNTLDELTGTGLGLKIIRDIVESYQGEVQIDNPPDNYSTSIRIELPITKPEETEDENF
ncbi:MULTISPECIES: sensor histidine kinase [Mesonia]|uniref:Sensor protein ZraS n=1 Tax=Mesonia oceanica TaxID=2687242 RepID=A0AC61Y919_9FLAO|nr:MULTISPECIES: sensor histidine kinase [Mesonia]MAN26128.1 ATP-binding protein [Mesonia sp.]MBJ96850.1 ATP-binding protein [Flavobacteriaceae bacterium]VVV00906.1 Sensor protein ZraS [Mesonia oceanica]|tara:strand:+ start:2975 stop:5293 length:2319 start_codon:yes stop_codon:yes gene_type:complete